MKKEDISRAMSMLDDDIINEAASYKQKKTIMITRWASIAASLIIAVLIAIPIIDNTAKVFDPTASVVGQPSSTGEPQLEDPNMPAPSPIPVTPMSSQSPSQSIIPPTQTPNNSYRDESEAEVYVKVLSVSEDSIYFVLKYTDKTLMEISFNVTDQNGNYFIVSTNSINNTAPQRYFDYFVSYGNSDNFVENQPLPDQGSFYVKVNYEDLLRAGYVTDGYIYIKNYGKVSLTQKLIRTKK